MAKYWGFQPSDLFLPLPPLLSTPPSPRRLRARALRFASLRLASFHPIDPIDPARQGQRNRLACLDEEALKDITAPANLNSRSAIGAVRKRRS